MANNSDMHLKKLKSKVGPEVWDRYMTSVKRGLLTQKEAEAAMLVERKKSVTKKNRERKANGPRPKSNRTKRREHAIKREMAEQAVKRPRTGHHSHYRYGEEETE